MSKYEEPDPQPIEIPAGFKKPETLAEQVKRLVRSERFAQEMEQSGNETFDEANDFDIEDDMWDPSSPYEEIFDPTLGRGITHDEFVRNEAEYRARFLAADAKAYHEMEISDALRARPRRAEQSGAAAGGGGTPTTPPDVEKK